jgi:Xaa-Pro aminopeptidase
MMPPFDANKLNTLLEEAGLDLLLVTTRHNIRYLTGGYHNHYHARMRRTGTTRYLTVLGLPQGQLDRAFFITGEEELPTVEWRRLWVPQVHATRQQDRTSFYQDSLSAARTTANIVHSLGFAGARIGLELPFLPAETYLLWRDEFPRARFSDATALLGELRAIKTEAELDLLRRNAAGTAEAMQATFRAGQAGTTTADLAGRLQLELVRRGLELQWILIAMGVDGPQRRWPSERAWQPGEILRIDAGGGLDDYLVDLSRMGCLGEPPKLAQAIFADCLAINDSVIRAIKPGLSCGQLVALAQEALKQSAFSQFGNHVTHGMGLVTHDPPEVEAGSERALEPGMVMSLEAQFEHPQAGDIRIEDMVAVTAGGCEPLGHIGREWCIV